VAGTLSAGGIELDEASLCRVAGIVSKLREARSMVLGQGEVGYELRFVDVVGDDGLASY
jgi:hypothetical protein